VHVQHPYFCTPEEVCIPVNLTSLGEIYRAALTEELKGTKDVAGNGDSRFDSMGHSAKYGAYTKFCSTIMKIVHFELLEVKFLQLLEIINLGAYDVPRLPVLSFLKCKILWISILTVLAPQRNLEIRKYLINRQSNNIVLMFSTVQVLLTILQNIYLFIS